MRRGKRRGGSVLLYYRVKNEDESCFVPIHSCMQPLLPQASQCTPLHPQTPRFISTIPMSFSHPQPLQASPLLPACSLSSPSLNPYSTVISPTTNTCNLLIPNRLPGEHNYLPPQRLKTSIVLQACIRNFLNPYKTSPSLTSPSPTNTALPNSS